MTFAGLATVRCSCKSGHLVPLITRRDKHLAHFRPAKLARTLCYAGRLYPTAL
jgi:hypothetical protein